MPPLQLNHKGRFFCNGFGHELGFKDNYGDWLWGTVVYLTNESMKVKFENAKGKSQIIDQKRFQWKYLVDEQLYMVTNELQSGFWVSKHFLTKKPESNFTKGIKIIKFTGQLFGFGWSLAKPHLEKWARNT